MPKSVKPKIVANKEAEARAVKIKVHTGGSNNMWHDNFQSWWNLPDDSIGNAVYQIILRNQQNSYVRRNSFYRYALLYGNAESLGWNNYSAFNRTEATNNRPVFNVVQSIVDTLNSKIARDNPEPYFTTMSGDYFEKLKAEKLNQFIEGVFQQCGFYDIANNKVFRDAGVYGTGGVFIKYNKAKDQIEFEWVFIDEFTMDRYDAIKGDPRSFERTYIKTREQLICEYPDKAELIKRVATTQPIYQPLRETTIDPVVVCEAWHLADKAVDGSDIENITNKGKHVVTIAGEPLLVEDYDECEYPFIFFRYYEATAGFYGSGVAERSLSGQIEINKILMQIQQAQELFASPLIITENGADISEDTLLTNNIARLVKIRSGTAKPEFLTPKPLDQQVYDHLKWWINAEYQQNGISMMSATGEKTPGVNAAVAMRTMVDIESTRFQQVSKNWEQFFVDVAYAIVRLAKQVYKKNGSLTVKWTDKRSAIIKEIDFAKLDLPDGSYTINCGTISDFPNTPSGKIQTITELFSNQIISKERMLESITMDPDLIHEVKLQCSSLRLVEKSLCSMVEDNVYIHPTKYLDLQLALKTSIMTYNQLQLDECPDDRLELVRNWISEIITLMTGVDPETQQLQAAIAPPQAPAAPTAIAPQAGVNPQ